MTGLLAAEYGTVSDIELLWTMIALGGFVFSIVNLRRAWGDSRAVREAPPDGRRLIARANLKLEAARATCQFIFFSIGVLAMLIADPPPQAHLPLKVVAISFAFRWGLITASALVSFQSYLNWRLRSTLSDIIKREHKPPLAASE